MFMPRIPQECFQIQCTDFVAFLLLFGTFSSFPIKHMNVRILPPKIYLVLPLAFVSIKLVNDVQST